MTVVPGKLTDHMMTTHIIKNLLLYSFKSRFVILLLLLLLLFVQLRQDHPQSETFT